MPALVVEQLIAGYGTKVLLRNLSFELPHPAFLAIIGHNGAGKSTLFRVLSRQLSFVGKVFVQGTDLVTLSNPAASGQLALLPQQNPVAFPVTVRELVVMGRFRQRRFFQSYSAADYRLADAALEGLGIAHLANAPFSELSGGEQQLGWLAQLTVQEAPLLLLDEPTQHLDVFHKKRVFEWMQVWVASGKTVLCITHDLPYLAGMNGFLLNLSQESPQLAPLSPERIRYHTQWLEESPRRR